MNAKQNQFTGAPDGGINFFDVLDGLASVALELVSGLLEAVLGL